MKLLVLFPHQLFEETIIQKLSPDKIILVEHPLFFKDEVYPLNFHKQKLILHRASMKAYFKHFSELGYTIDYLDYSSVHKVGQTFNHLISLKPSQILLFDPVDFILEKRIHKYLKTKVNYTVLQTPLFLNSKQENLDYFSKNQFFQHKFYIHQRKKYNILIQDNKPTGGKWSYDAENRKKLPKNISLPQTYSFHLSNQEAISEASEYISKNFPDSIGSSQEFIYPITHSQAKQALTNFLENKLSQFGDYEDAIDPDHSFLFHSVLTPALNIGLLTPKQVLQQTLDFSKTHNIPLNSLEGFIRQILSWREFMRATYQIKGSQIRNSNFWKHQNKLSSHWYKANTGILPIDQTIKKVLQTAYSHHIERLMILGNFMCLCRLNPHEVYKWFMELYIDAYDWVMVPNVYSMSQFADGGSITTKPYISSSNYIRKMSSYPKGEWEEIWTSLYWAFIYDNKSFFQSNYRLNMMVKILEKMPNDKIQDHLDKSKNFLDKLKNT